TAGDGAQGVAMAKSESPDIILLDMNMPVVDGWQAAREIRAFEKTQNVAIIGLTAHSMEGDREKALAAGCVDYHTKPIDFDALVAQMEVALKATPAPGSAPATTTPPA